MNPSPVLEPRVTLGKSQCQVTRPNIKAMTHTLQQDVMEHARKHTQAQRHGVPKVEKDSEAKRCLKCPLCHVSIADQFTPFLWYLETWSTLLEALVLSTG